MGWFVIVAKRDNQMLQIVDQAASVDESYLRFCVWFSSCSVKEDRSRGQVAKSFVAAMQAGHVEIEIGCPPDGSYARSALEIRKNSSVARIAMSHNDYLIFLNMSGCSRDQAHMALTLPDRHFDERTDEQLILATEVLEGKSKQDQVDIDIGGFALNLSGSDGSF